MYARLQTMDTGTAPAEVYSEQDQARLVDTVSGHPGFRGIYMLTDPETESGTLLTLWDSEEDARRASERTAAQLGPRRAPLSRDEICEVTDSWLGAAAGQPVTDVMLLTFDGPLSQESLDAARFAGRERLTPALIGVPGVVGGYALWQPDRRAQYIVNLATSAAALRELGERAMSTELLPGEDPALLPGPDRVAALRAVAQATALTHS